MPSALRQVLPVRDYCRSCAIYSTFLQRAYDQIIHDVNLMKEDVVFLPSTAQDLFPETAPSIRVVADEAFLASNRHPWSMHPPITRNCNTGCTIAAGHGLRPSSHPLPPRWRSANLAQYPCTKREYDFWNMPPGRAFVLVSYADETGGHIGGRQSIQRCVAECRRSEACKAMPLYR